MKKAPFITGDGQLVDVSDVHFNRDLAAPQVFGVMVFPRTSDAFRGLVRDICDRSCGDAAALSTYLDISGRSGHSRLGIDIEFGQGVPVISDSAKSIEIPVVITALNKMLAESLADLKTLTAREQVDIGRLFIPLGPPLPRSEVQDALDRNWLLLPDRYKLCEDGVIEVPLDNIRYILSSRLLGANHNFSEMIVRGKHALSLFQNISPTGLPEFLGPKEFLVSATRISLGPYAAFIERPLSHPDVFHLASRLLDGIRTTGIATPRQVEIYNKGDSQVPTRDLKVRIRLYPADERVAGLAERILTPVKAPAIIARGVDFSELTDIFTPETCASLFDEVTLGPGRSGSYGRILMPDKMINIPWEQEDGKWVPEFQWRLIYEFARANLPEGVLEGDEIPKRFRDFLTGLRYVGGEQKLSKAFIADSLPPVDTLRVLKRNGIGVVLIRSLNARVGREQRPDLCFDQATYEELFRLEKEGMRFYLLMDEVTTPQVREFYRGLWVTVLGKERLDTIHTTVAMFGSTVDSLKELLREQFTNFLGGLKANPRLGENFAVAHGSGPGVMKIVDDVAAGLGIFRIGVGIDAEKMGQVPNMGPDAVVQFINLALNTRQDILDRRSIFKVFNIGGYGTSYEINMALTFMKIGHCMPAPYIFVDPLGLGENGSHLWEQTIRQFQTIAREKEAGGGTIEPLGPAWIINCCHMVRDYQEGLAIIERFIDDPRSYWKERGVPLHQVLTAHENLGRAGVTIPPYIEEALRQDLAQQAG